MWFSNIQLYQFTQPFTLDAPVLSKKLQAFRFKPCGTLQPASYGWSTPLGKHGDDLIHTTNGNIMICARKDEKILPASVVREIVEEKIEEIEEKQARKLRKKEKESIKDEVVHDLLPRAFLRSHRTFAYISLKKNQILVNASSRKKAEELLDYLRKSLGTLPVVPINLVNAPSTIMTRWVSGEEVPIDFLINDECELHDTIEDGGVIRCKRQNLEAEEIQAHIDAGKQVVKLSVTWQEILSCIINEDFSITRIKFSNDVLEQADSAGAEDYAIQFDEDFAIMALELERFIPRLIDVFGGEELKTKPIEETKTMEPAL